jgi:hypothetical protein
VRHALRRSKKSTFRVAIPKAGTGVLVSSVTLASVMWVSISLPNMPMLGALAGDRTSGVAISLQSALLGIDDGKGRSPRDRRTLARVLGLSRDSLNLPSLAQLRAMGATSAAQEPVVAQLAVLRINDTSTGSTAQQHGDAAQPQPSPGASGGSGGPSGQHGDQQGGNGQNSPSQPRSDPPKREPPDTVAPTIQSHANILVAASGPAGGTVTYSIPTASDAREGRVPVVCTPASGSVFPIGSTTVTCRATDGARNEARITFVVVVRDVTPPILVVPADLQVPTTSALGTYISYRASASDGVGGAVSVNCIPASGTRFPVGHTTVTCTAEDPSHNISRASFDVHVLADQTPPVVQPHVDLIAEATGASGAVVTYIAPTAEDGIDGALGALCTPASSTVFPIGVTTVACAAEDASHNVGRTTFTVLVRDTTPPAIQSHADVIAAATPGGTVVNYTPPSATDTVGGSLAVTCAPLSGSTFALGQTPVTCSAEDAAGNRSSSGFSVNVGDTTPPVIQNHADLVAEATSSSGAIVAYTTPAANDSLDGPVAVACAPTSGSTFALGHTTVTCGAQDSAGNNASSSFDIHVRDTTGPSIQAHANLIAEATAPSGAAVSYIAPVATDLVSGTVAVACAPVSGSTFTLGHTTVTCGAQDAAGNSASSTFDVHVRDTTAPAIQAHANLVTEATGSTGAAVTYTTPTASDLVSGTVTVTCAPVSGSTFAVGHTTVTCSAQDAAGNNGSSTFDIHVRDTTAPTIQTHANIVAEATGPSGAAVTYTAPTATDLVSTPTVTCVAPSGSTFALGHTTVTCSAQDAAGNTSTTTSFDIHVRDTTPPTITVPADITVEADTSAGVPVTYATSATDLVSGSVAVFCNHPSGSNFSMGHTTVTCFAWDGTGNISSRTFDVNVIESPNFQG